MPILNLQLTSIVIGFFLGLSIFSCIGIEGFVNAWICFGNASVFLNFLKDYVPLEGEDNFVDSKTCSELN